MREGKAAEYLGTELENIVLHGRLTLEPWPDGLGWEHAAPDYDDTEKSQGTGGSNNWPISAFGSRYALDFRGRGWHREKEAAEFFAKARTAFLGSELDSTIYTYMQAHAVLEVCHVARQIGAPATAGEAMKWLQYLAARCEMFRSERLRRILTCGDRSAALLEPGERSWQDHFADLGMGRRSVPSERILTARADLVREAFAPMRTGGRQPLDLLRELGFRTLVPVRVAEWAGGKAVWRNGSRWNGNTQPVAIAFEHNGGEAYAPSNRGFTGNPKDKTHRRNGAPTVTEFPTGLRYESPVYPSATFSLPPKEQRTLDVEIGGVGFVRDLLATAPPPEPGRPTPFPEPHPGDPPKPPKKDRSWL